jgi:hypothetical protein
MLKKLFVTVAAAAAVSVPLAGVAWADPPSDPGSNGNGLGKGGIPTKLGNSLSNSVSPNANPNPGGVGPVTPGSAINMAKDLFPGVSTPVAVGDFLTAFGATHTSAVPGFNPQTTPFGPTAPGLVIKALSPGCGNGHTGVTQPGASTCTP